MNSTQEITANEPTPAPAQTTAAPTHSGHLASLLSHAARVDIGKFGSSLNPQHTVESDRSQWQELVLDWADIENFKPMRHTPMPPCMREFRTPKDFKEKVLDPHRHSLPDKPDWKGRNSWQSEAERSDKSPAIEFAEWRESATHIEAENAGKLLGLCNAVMAATELKDRQPSEQTNEMALRFIRKLLEYYGAIDMPKAHCERRDWATAKMKRFDVLPKEWRGL